MAQRGPAGRGRHRRGTAGGGLRRPGHPAVAGPVGAALRRRRPVRGVRGVAVRPQRALTAAYRPARNDRNIGTRRRPGTARRRPPVGAPAARRCAGRPPPGLGRNPPASRSSPGSDRELAVLDGLLDPLVLEVPLPQLERPRRPLAGEPPEVGDRVGDAAANRPPARAPGRPRHRRPHVGDDLECVVHHNEVEAPDANGRPRRRPARTRRRRPARASRTRPSAVSTAVTRWPRAARSRTTRPSPHPISSVRRTGGGSRSSKNASGTTSRRRGRACGPSGSTGRRRLPLPRGHAARTQATHRAMMTSAAAELHQRRHPNPTIVARVARHAGPASRVRRCSPT